MVLVDITIENTSSERIVLISNRLGPGQAGITIWDSIGNELPRRGEFQSYSSPSNFGQIIDPGKSATETVDLNRWFNLTKPGQYTVQARKRIPGTNSFVESNKLTITITP